MTTVVFATVERDCRRPACSLVGHQMLLIFEVVHEGLQLVLPNPQRTFHLVWEATLSSGQPRGVLQPEQMYVGWPQFLRPPKILLYFGLPGPDLPFSGVVSIGGTGVTPKLLLRKDLTGDVDLVGETISSGKERG